MTSCEWYWGVDVRTQLVAVGAVNDTDDTTLWWSIPIPQGAGALRLSAIREETFRFAKRTCTGEHLRLAPTACVVEAPFVRTTEFPLLSATAVVMEALYTALGCPVLELPSASWKLKALGRGNASKDDILHYARLQLGYSGQLQDEADALVIACAARSLMRRAAA